MPSRKKGKYWTLWGDPDIHSYGTYQQIDCLCRDCKGERKSLKETKVVFWSWQLRSRKSFKPYFRNGVKKKLVGALQKKKRRLYCGSLTKLKDPRDPPVSNYVFLEWHDK